MTSYVFHPGGALGDFMLCWPLLRALKNRGKVTLVTSSEKGRFAASELGLIALNSERREYARLWADDEAEMRHAGSPPNVESVVAFTSDPAGVWKRNATVMFPRAAIECVKDVLTRRLALELAARHDLSRAIAKAECHGWPSLKHGARFAQRDRSVGVEGKAIAMHVGAGSEAKRWPMIRWLDLAERMRRRRANVTLIAGDVEAERLRTAERHEFMESGGRLLGDLPELVAAIRESDLLIASDSGPGHLASQIGVPVMSLFGPTSPSEWAPIGRTVKVLSPPTPCGMEWLSADRAEAEAAAMLGEVP